MCVCVCVCVWKKEKIKQLMICVHLFKACSLAKILPYAVREKSNGRQLEMLLLMQAFRCVLLCV